MAGDYIPNPDAEFNTWQTNFSNYVSAHLADLGLVTGDVTAINSAKTAWGTGYTNHVAAQSAAYAARESKDMARSTYQTAIRALVQKLQISPSVTNDERQAMGITVRGEGGPDAALLSESRPLATVDTSQRLRHTINFFDEASPTSRAKPAGVMGCEIWLKVGDPAPADPSELELLALDTRTPYVNDFPGAQAGQKAHYMLRWVKRSGEKGPWSETVSATIPG